MEKSSVLSAKSKNSIERVPEEYFHLLHKKDAKVLVESSTTRQLLCYENDSRLVFTNRLDNTVFQLVAPPAEPPYVPSSPSLASTLLGQVGGGMGWWSAAQKLSPSPGPSSLGSSSSTSSGDNVASWLLDNSNTLIARQVLKNSEGVGAQVREAFLEGTGERMSESNKARTYTQGDREVNEEEGKAGSE